MKANELMIGDWVLEKSVDYVDGVIKYVEEKRNVTTNMLHQLYNQETGILGKDNLYSIQVEPIPLTAEILEKNGFTHSFGDSDFYDYEKWEKKVDDKTIRVIKDNDRWFCRVDDKKLTRSMGISPAVHTMQNIIRIGGIEKNIEL